MEKNNLRKIFDELSTDKEFIQKKDLQKHLKEKGIYKEELEKNFFEKLDANKDGKISFSEFTLCYTMANTQFNALVDQMGFLTQSMRHLENFKKVVNDAQEKEYQLSLKIKDSHIQSENELKTFLKIFAGLPQNEENKKLLEKMPAEKSIGFSFSVQNKEEFLEKLKEIMEEVKDLLKELGQQFHEIVDQIEFKYLVDEQVHVFIDLTKIQQLNQLLGIFDETIESVEKTKSNFKFTLGSDYCFSDYKNIKTENLSKLGLYFNLTYNLKNLSDKYAKEEIMNLLQQQNVKSSNYIVYLIITALSLKKTNLEVEFDSEQKQELFLKYKFLSNVDMTKDIEKIKEQLEENGVTDILNSFDFISQLFELLNEQNCKEFTFSKNYKNILLKIDMKGKFGQFVEDLEIF